MMANITRTVNPASFCRSRQWRRRVLAFSGDSAAESSPREVSSRPFSDQRLRLEDTPSQGKILKEPLCFYELEPTVLGVIQKLRFLVLKTYLISVIQKYVF
jgi:hypothetical protein